jgi:ABC-type transport system involved in cytochrome c biogenesis ATPase subunit
MKLSLEKLGALTAGDLELADLTIICGENNTGKTYLTYTLYGLLRTWDTFVKLPDFDLQPLQTNGVMEIDLADRIMKQAPQIMQAAVDHYCESLYRVLAAQEKRFIDTRLALQVDFTNVLAPAYQRDFTTDRSRRIISFVKQADETKLTINAATEESSRPLSRFGYQPLIDRVLKEICFAPVLPEPFIVSTERTGAVTFQGELNLAKNRLIDLAHEVTGPESLHPSTLLERVYGGGYPLPVKDNVDFINSLAGIQSTESELLKEEPTILDEFENLIGGSYKVQSDALHFVPKGAKGVHLRMGESSSSVRSLLVLGYYLKHRAQKGDLLMIDEPELNLHPANQRRLARLLVRLVNAGIKVFVTTHSDYIVKEFNTLIMLNSEAPGLDEVRERWGYAHHDRLGHDRVHLYMLSEDYVQKNGNKRKTKAPTLCKAKISPTLGIQVPTFDQTINEMNAIQDAIYYHQEPIEQELIEA